jgi:hypothetical protein
MAKNTLLLELFDTSDASGDVVINSNPLQRGKTLCIQRVTVLSNDTDNVVAHVALKTPTGTIGLVTIAMASKTYYYTEKINVWVPSETRVQVTFDAAGNAKPVYAWVYGYLD